MDISTSPSFRSNEEKRRSTAYKRMVRTIKVHDWLRENGYKPYDCSISVITMQRVAFKDFVTKGCGGKCSKQVTRGGTIYSVWISYVEITHLDVGEKCETWEECEL